MIKVGLQYWEEPWQFLGLTIVRTEGKDDLVRRISLLKRNAMAAPFERSFDEFARMQEEASKYTRESAPEGVAEGGEVMAIHYREEEAIYIKASHDRVTVIFSTIFREETDRIFGKVFLQVSSPGSQDREEMGLIPS